MKKHLEKNDNLHYLEELTKKLTPFDKMIKRDSSNYVELNSIGGPIIGFNLFKDEKILVSRFLMTDGSCFPRHQHDGIHEFLFVVDGRVILHFDDKEVTLNKLEKIMIQPGVPHSGIAEGNTWLICISMPPEPMFEKSGETA